MSEKTPMNDYHDFLRKNFCNLSANSFRSINSQILYHYTSIESLKNIMDNNTLWISNVYYLNDSMEIQYAEELIKSILEKSTQINKQVKDKIGEYIEKAKKELSNMYVLSLTDNNDLLTLWSNYSKLEGYNFGIDLYEFENGIFDGTAAILLNNHKLGEIYNDNNIDESICNWKICKVIYNESDQRNHVNDLINSINDFYKYKLNSNKSDLIDGTVAFMLTYFTDILVFFKNPKFYPEEEYRITFEIKDDYSEKVIHHRISNGAFIPYIKICFTQEKKIPIKSVMIGPRNKSDIAIEGFKSYCKTNGFLDLEDIKASKIPLRY